MRRAGFTEDSRAWVVEIMMMGWVRVHCEYQNRKERCVRVCVQCIELHGKEVVIERGGLHHSLC